MMLSYLKQSWFFFRRNITTIAAIQLPFIITLNLLFTQLDFSAGQQNSQQLTDSLMMITLFNLAMMPIYWGATIIFMQSSVEGKAYTASQALLGSLKYWPKLFLIFTLTSFGIFAGLMAFVLPGIYIAIRLALADYYCIIKGQNAMSSLKQSWSETQEYFWLLLQGLCAIFLGSLALEFITLHLLSSVFNNSIAVQLPVNVAFDLFNSMLTIYAFRIFCLIEKEKAPL
ncbi:MAG: YciC family protein [Pseudomonadales bacterium]